jgi:predicted GNAT family acetyltransferase
MTDAPVTRDDQQQRFELVVDGHPAFLTFRQEEDRITLVHTEVPEALEGRGLGGRLVQTALDYARTNDLTVVPHCPYVKSYLERHPEEARDLRVASADA